MSLVGLVVVLIVIGVLLWLLNTKVASVMDPTILTIINIIVVVVVVLWVLGLVVDLGPISRLRVGATR